MLLSVCTAACTGEPSSPSPVTAPLPAEVSPHVTADVPSVAPPAVTSTPVPACEATSPRPLHVEIVVTPDDGDTRVIALVNAAEASVDVTIFQLFAAVHSTKPTNRNERATQAEPELERPPENSPW